MPRPKLPGTHYSRNRERKLAYQNEYYAEDPKRRRRTRVGRYGLTLDSYEKLLQAQDGKCAICLQLPDQGTNLAIDHDHKSGVVRGLLCSGCNRGIGFFNDDEVKLLRAIAYLQVHSKAQKAA